MPGLLTAWLIGLALCGVALAVLLLTDTTPVTRSCARCGTPTESITGLCRNCQGGAV